MKKKNIQTTKSILRNYKNNSRREKLNRKAEN